VTGNQIARILSVNVQTVESFLSREKKRAHEGLRSP